MGPQPLGEAGYQVVACHLASTRVGIRGTASGLSNSSATVKIRPVEDSISKGEHDAADDAPSDNEWSGTKKMLVTSLAVSGVLLLVLLLTIWLGGEPAPLSVDYDGFD